MLDGSHFYLENDNNLNHPCSYGMPILRIGLIEEKDSIEFKSTGKFSVFTDQGIAILKGVTAPVKWRLNVVNRQPAKYEYSILLQKFDNRQDAEEQEYKLIERGIGARIKTLGGEIYYNNKVINDNSEYLLVVDNLTSEQEARSFAEKMFSEIDYKIIKIKINEPHALLELFDTEFEKLGEAENMIRVVPDSEDVITYVYDLKVNEKKGESARNYMAFRGSLEFRCMDEGRICVICEMPFEEYVKNVVAFQMQDDFPIEVIKAQATAVRSKTIAGLCVKHYDDPFDLCSDDHCQPFAGMLSIPETVSKAVQETKGIVLIKKKRVVDANYSPICGGHTEAYRNLVCDASTEPYPPVFDGRNKDDFKAYKDLTKSKNLIKWVTEEPNVYCNFSHHKDLTISSDFKKFFRWQITYDRTELEEIISRNTGKDIGDLYEIIPVSRGVSGRIREIEILASNINLLIKGEVEICKTVCDRGLPSSCFIIEPQFDEEGFPISFTFRGAGLGHGVGLCQAGAIAMAEEGAKFNDILHFYYRNTQIKKNYEE